METAITDMHVVNGLDKVVQWLYWWRGGDRISIREEVVTSHEGTNGVQGLTGTIMPASSEGVQM